MRLHVHKTSPALVEVLVRAFRAVDFLKHDDCSRIGEDGVDDLLAFYDGDRHYVVWRAGESEPMRKLEDMVDQISDTNELVALTP